MGILSDLKNLLFKSESINTNVQSNNFRFANRISIGGKRYNITYQQGMQVLEDLTVKMSYETLKYILSSKQYVLVANSDDEIGVHDFIEQMLFNMETELSEIIKREIEGTLWGFHLEELIFNINEDGKLVLTNMVPLDIKTLQNKPFVYDDDGNLISIHQEYRGQAVDIPINKVLKYT